MSKSKTLYNIIPLQKMLRESYYAKLSKIVTAKCRFPVSIHGNKASGLSATYLQLCEGDSECQDRIYAAVKDAWAITHCRFAPCGYCGEPPVGKGSLSIDGAPKRRMNLCQCHLDAANEDCPRP